MGLHGGRQMGVRLLSRPLRGSIPRSSTTWDLSVGDSVGDNSALGGVFEAPRFHYFFGAVAHLGERTIRTGEVVGSSPIGSTTIFR